MPIPSHNCPWNITDSAARDLLRITGRGPNELVTALAELRQFARDIVASEKAPRELDSGRLQYRTGRPLRARLIVEPGQPSSTLVQVLPDHAQREGAYTRTTHGQTARATKRQANDASHLAMVELERLSATELRDRIARDSVAIERVLQYLSDRDDISDRQYEAAQLSRDILAKVAGVSEGTWAKWANGAEGCPIAARRAIIWAAYGIPAALAPDK